MFNGEAEEAAAFYANLLGGKIENLYRYDEMPPAPDYPPVPEDAKQRIMHCCIIFPGGSMSLADTLPSDPRSFRNGGYMLTLSCNSIAQVEEAYGKLACGAKKINCPLGEAFYAKRYGEVVDKYGVLWAVMYEDA
jgi:PhnB protein